MKGLISRLLRSFHGSFLWRLVLRCVYYSPLRLRLDQKWYTATTSVPDRQLQGVIEQFRSRNTKYPTRGLILSDIYQNTGDPYVGFVKNPCLPQPSEYGVHLSAEILSRAQNYLGRPPKAMIEVGSFIGGSAVLLGYLARTNGGIVLCVDPWCGDINMWLLPRFATTMAIEHGSPRIYERFLARILAEGLSDVVLPVRLPSTLAARMFRVLKYHFDLIYLDSAHEFGETYLELQLYYDLLAPGGVLIGDDYSGFPAVRHDLNYFAAVRGITGLRIMDDGDTWMLKRPGRFLEDTSAALT
jgi:hypothetical protein